MGWCLLAISVTAVVLAASMPTVSGIIRCYVCSGPECENATSLTTDQEFDCPANAGMCVKITTEGSPIIARGCDLAGQKNGCQQYDIPTNPPVIEHKCRCSGNLCNAAGKSGQNIGTVVVASILSIVVLFSGQIYVT